MVLSYIKNTQKNYLSAGHKTLPLLGAVNQTIVTGFSKEWPTHHNVDTQLAINADRNAATLWLT